MRPRYRVRIFRTLADCTELEFVTLPEALSYCYSARAPGFSGRLQLWDHQEMIQSWEGGRRSMHAN